MTILIAGGTGLIGQRLQELFRQQGHHIRILTRTPKMEGQYAWNPAQHTLDETALQGADAVINLAGSGIADRRWTAARKADLINSRTESMRTLSEAMARTGHRPKVVIAASAVGIYGDTGEALQTEETPIAQAPRDFMIECCDQWEQAANAFTQLGIRTVKLRIGVVLAKEGGALAEIIKPLRLGLGAYFADGQAWMPWVHLDDICGIIYHAIVRPDMEGVYNAGSPNPARNIELTRAAAKAMGQWAAFLPAPSFALRLMLGEMSAVVLNSNRVSADKLVKSGYVFRYPEVGAALDEIFSK